MKLKINTEACKDGDGNWEPIVWGSMGKTLKPAIVKVDLPLFSAYAVCDRFDQVVLAKDRVFSTFEKAVVAAERIAADPVWQASHGK